MDMVNNDEQTLSNIREKCEEVASQCPSDINIVCWNSDGQGGTCKDTSGPAEINDGEFPWQYLLYGALIVGAVIGCRCFCKSMQKQNTANVDNYNRM